MQEEADAVLVPAPPQLMSEGNEVIVVDPDGIIGSNELRQLAPKVRVDPQVARQVTAGKLGEVEPVVQDWPQNAIGKSVVELLVILLGEIRQHIRRVRPLYRLGRRFRIWHDASAPSEPQSWMALEDRAQGDLQPAGAAVAFSGRNGDTVGDEYQPRQYRSSQLRDKRMAVRISPAIE
jgi:hypothetical protein